MSKNNNEILRYLAELELNPTQQKYVDYHSERYAFLIGIIQELIQNLNAEGISTIRILDIGPSFQTHLIRNIFPQCLVNSLGYNNQFNVLRENEKHIQIDLNKSETAFDLLNEEAYHILVFCEVIEHLHTAPTIILKGLKKLMMIGSYVVIQTPNAVSLPNRVAMMLGQNPFMLIRENMENAGHFREYTMKELLNYLISEKFSLVKTNRKNYFKGETLVHKIYHHSGPLLPSSWRQGMTVVAKL